MGANPVFTSDEPINEDRVRAALREHGPERTVICGDMPTWLIANRIVGLGIRHDFTSGQPLPVEHECEGDGSVRQVDEWPVDADLSNVLVVEPSDMVKLDDSLGAGRWGLR